LQYLILNIEILYCSLIIIVIKEAMDLQTSVKTCLSKYADFKGRAIRSEYWWFQLFAVISTFVAAIFDSFFVNNIDSAGPVEIIVSLGLLIPNLAVTARRLHDVNRSGWWMLIPITIIGIIPYIIWVVTQGDGKKNRFGAAPKII